MIDYKQYQISAALGLASTAANEVGVRRSRSAVYYGLFHRLAAEGAAAFHCGGKLLTQQAARSYSHSSIKAVSQTYGRLPVNPLPSPLDRLAPPVPDPRIIDIAQSFVVLPKARHSADYDVSGEFLRSTALKFLFRAEHAHWMLSQTQGLSETTIFLTAFLLHDRWKNRG